MRGMLRRRRYQQGCRCRGKQDRSGHQRSVVPDCWFPRAGNNSPQIAPPTGAPAITVPMGYARDVAQAPLPAGLQMLGRPWDEARLLRLAYAFEQATQYRR